MKTLKKKSKGKSIKKYVDCKPKDIECQKKLVLQLLREAPFPKNTSRKNIFRTEHKKNPSLINIPKNNIDSEIFEDLNPCYKNSDLFDNLNIKSKINFSEILLNSNLCCNLKYSLSYFNKKQILDFKECKNNYHIISNIISKELYIYLLHPKYKDLTNEDLLKSSEKVLIKPYDILIIPFGWKYLQEINEKTINYHIDVDNYFTFIHNSILNKI